jgi:aspartate 1-decarboxylase
MLKGKIHRATVTEANVDYRGSITLDPLLMEAADILPFEQVHVLDITNGARLETYAIEGERGSGCVCLNGAAALLVHEGDLVIVVAYDLLTEEEARNHKPRLVYVNERNQITEVASDVPVGVH